MELFTILLSSLLALISPAGVILDRVIDENIRAQVKGVEQLAVRLDNTPSYQIIEGKVDKIRIASRGIFPIENLRIEALELETDPLNIDLARLQQGGDNSLRQSLRRPLQAAIRLVIKESDINQALQSTEIKSRLQQLVNNLIPQQDGLSVAAFELLNARIEFLENNRLRLQIQVQQSQTENQPSETLALILEVGVNLVAGRSLQLIEPTGTLNGRKLSTRLLHGFAERLSQQLDLQTLEKQGITARVLQFKLTDEEIDLAAFIRLAGLEPTSQFKEQSDSLKSSSR